MNSIIYVFGKGNNVDEDRTTMFMTIVGIGTIGIWDFDKVSWIELLRKRPKL